MLRFKQFLLEGLVPFYHKTDPRTAARLVSGEKIKPQGLSVFIDPAKAAEYTDITSAGHIPANAQTVTGTVSTRRLVPDIEWNPESYKEIFKDVATKIEADPNYRVPSLTRVAISSSKGPMQFVTPGIVAETDPTTGKKKIGRGWEPGFALEDEKTKFLGEPKRYADFPIEVDGKKIDIDDPRIKPVIQSRSTVTPYGTVGPQTTAWGGHGKSTVGGRFPETRDLDVLARDSDLRKVTDKAIATNKEIDRLQADLDKATDPATTEKLKKDLEKVKKVEGFRTKGGSGINVSGITDPTQAVKSTGKAVGKAALKMLPVIGTAASIAAMTQRAQAGDYVGAGLEGASELADYIPGPGTAVSLGIQSVLADRDMSDEERKESEQRAARQALRSMKVYSPRY
jgi:hypothetical protein